MPREEKPLEIKRFRAFMEGYVDFLEEMAAGEAEKYAAILSFDPKRMDKVVARQQAMNMRLGQLEEQREKEQKAAGIAALTFQEIIDRLQGPEKQSFEEIASRFYRAVREIKYFNEKSMSFVQDGLKAAGAAQETPKAPYDHSGKSGDTSGASIFEAQI